MRKAISFLLVLFLSPPAFSQGLEWGVKGGIPLSRYFRTAGSSDLGTSYRSLTNRYTVGPTIEVHLAGQIGVELDFLYKHFQFEKFVFSPTNGPIFDTLVRTKTTANSWEVPLLVKYHASEFPLRTYLEAGPSFQSLSNVRQTRTTWNVATSGPPELLEVITTSQTEGVASWSSNTGFVMGAGMEFRVKSLGISPGMRTTLWRHKSLYSAPNASFDGLLGHEQNQVEFLMGFTFRTEGRTRN